ncbi:MAG TPA: hypothetical protein DFS52_06535 [Myxococcales bacterium]|nr:hypothetical protein [Myxococcales bacterium]
MTSAQTSTASSQRRAALHAKLVGQEFSSHSQSPTSGAQVSPALQVMPQHWSMTHSSVVGSHRRPEGQLSGEVVHRHSPVVGTQLSPKSQ